MNYQHLSNEALLALALQKSKDERELTLEVVNLICEVDRRRLYLPLGFGSLFDFVVQKLGFEEGAALRRISAARLIQAVPEVEQKLSQGRLSLSVLSQAQSFFRKEEKLLAQASGKARVRLATKEKREILLKLENQSAREAQKTLLGLSPEQVTLAETQRVVGSEHTELKLVIKDTLREKLERLKCLLSHKNPNMTTAELIEELAELALQKLDPQRKGQTKRQTKAQTSLDDGALKKNQANHPTPEKVWQPLTSEVDLALAADSKSQSKYQSKTQSKSQPRAIPRPLRRQVWARDQG